MSDAAERPAPEDPFDLARFTRAQASSYPTALAELRAGRKESHWMWFIFPQIAGLGYSATSHHYAISGLEEARQYLRHPVLGARLRACAETLLAVGGRTALAILGSPDDRKLQSSMTLFAQAAGPDSVFGRVLERYFGGQEDAETLRRLAD